MFIQSIRWRLQLWMAFLLLCVLAGFAVTVYQLQRINLFNQLDENLERRLAALDLAVRVRPPFGPPPDGGKGRPYFEMKPGERKSPDTAGAPENQARDSGPGEETRRPHPPGYYPTDGPFPFGPRGLRLEQREIKLSDETAALFDETQTNAYYFIIWSRGGTLLRQSTNAPAEVAQPERQPGDTRTHVRLRESYREAFHFTEMGDCVLTGRSLVGDLKALDRFKLLLLAAGGAVLALGLGGGWWLAGRAIRPIEEISAAAGRISAGNLSERINVAEADTELGRLAGALNSTFARLEAAFAQQKQFTADASHELRTPIAILIAETQSTLARERNAAEYRETLEGCLETAQQMRRLTDSLLELARFDAGQETMKQERIDLAAKAGECLDMVRPLAAQRGVTLKSTLQPAECAGDPDRLGQVATNLLANAILYNRDHGEVMITTRVDTHEVLLAVADNGPGIAAEDLPHLFKRFYRADKARGRTEGRTGLGLAICKAIVEAHGGAIEVASQPGAGSTFTVRLPKL